MNTTPPIAGGQGPFDKPEVSIRDLAGAGMDASSVGLVGDILTASARGLAKTQDMLWETERRRRMVLEVQIDMFLDAAATAHMGSAREYEKAIDVLRYPLPDEVLLLMHHEYKPDDH